MNQRAARTPGAAVAWLILLSALMALRYFWVFTHHPLGPHNNHEAAGWFGWADQGEYFRAAKAWASGNLDPSQHHYPAGYALLGALFVPITPGEPFVIPDLLCWVASLWLFASLGARLAAGVPGARAISATVFFLVEVGDLHALYTWEVPWTSTPAATATFAALSLAVCHMDTGRIWQASTAMLLAGLVVLFRPADASIIMGAVGICILCRAWSTRAEWRRSIGGLAAAGGAAAIGPLLLVTTHVATHGWTLGPYFTESRLMGFEWRLLPLRWVTLLLSPLPLYPAGQGLARVYWFVLPGLAGIATAIAVDRGRRLRHIVVGGAAIVFLCLYLCYRDLHVLGLFQYQNQHYFKWTLPILALYALALLYFLVIRRQLMAGTAAVAMIILLSCWRAQFVTVSANPAVTILADGTGLALPHGLGAIDGAVLVAAPEDFLSQYFGVHALESGGHRFASGTSFKLMPVPFGFMLFPLRRLPAGPAELRLADPIRLAPSATVLTGRQEIVFGLPCLIAPRRSACRYRPLLAPARRDPPAR